MCPLTEFGVCDVKPINGKISQKGILGVGSAHRTFDDATLRVALPMKQVMPMGGRG